MKNHYRTLGVARDASAQEIKAAYKRLALRYHPDRNLGNKSAEEFFKEVNEAYHVLNNSLRKSRYDMLLDLHELPAEQKTFTPYHYQPYSYQTRPHPGKFARTYRFDKSYFKNQALALLIVLIIGVVVISVTEFDKFLKAQAREEIRIENEKILSSAHVKFTMGDFYGALRIVENLAAKNPADFDLDKERDKMIEELFNKARRQFVLEDYNNAIFNLLIVKEFQHPQKLQTYEYLARSYSAIQDYQKSVDAYEYILLRDQYNLELVMKIASIYHYDIKNISRAMRYYDKAKSLFKDRQRQLYGEAFELLMDPAGTPDIYFTLFYHRAKANIEAGYFETAVTDCNWAAFLRKDNNEVYYLRAFSYSKLNEHDRACSDYKLAIKKGFNSATAQNHFCNNS